MKTLEYGCKKDCVYTIRMNRELREELNAAAKQDCRSAASLIHKVLIDHLNSRNRKRLAS